MSVFVYRLDDKPLPEDLREKLIAAARILLTEHHLEHGNVAIILAGDSMLQELNRNYRGLDYPTDVLSFAMLEPADRERAAAGDHDEVTVGDIYISLDRAHDQAVAAGHSCEREALILAIHGLLHLCGYDHENNAAAASMQQKEVEILNLVERSSR